MLLFVNTPTDPPALAEAVIEVRRSLGEVVERRKDLSEIFSWRSIRYPVTVDSNHMLRWRSGCSGFGLGVTV